jgi:hypothetical protein
MRTEPREIGELMQVHCIDYVRFVFGQVLWGAPRIEVPVMPGDVVLADRVLCLPPGGSAAFAVSAPAYVEGCDGQVTVFDVDGADVTEDAVCHDAWAAWKSAVGVIDRTGFT